MNNLKILNSNIDKSVNFVENQLVGFLESRFVRKCDDYFICYLSSQTGCNKGCQFCHLTVTKQTQFTDSDSNDFYSQAMQVFRHYRQEKTKARYVHYNFMARGEVLDNKYFLTDADEILYNLGKLASNEHLGTKFNISTIFPLSFRDKSLVDIFKIIHPTIYYSLYSCNEDFRQKWMPGALSVEESFEKLKEYQRYSKKKVKIHYPFIKGENDSLRDIAILIGFLNEYKLDVEFNLVRYNPATPEQGEESDEKIITRNINHLKDYLGSSNVKIIPRVGFDVAASCGMFVK